MTFFFLLCFLAGFALCGGYYAYRIAFFSPRKNRNCIPDTSSPKYDPYRSEMKRIFEQLQNRPFETVTTRSRDGLMLSGRYYHVQDGAPLDIGFHGYRSSPLTDFSGGSELSFHLGHNLLLVDQRAHGNSEGKTISFGIQERYDVLSWANFAVQRFGQDTKIILYGISMGAATVLMASELELPANVRGIIADCPYSSALDIILHVGKKTSLPQWLIRPFTIWGAKVFGGFDVQEITAAQAVAYAKIPILIIHGEADTFVPCAMSDIAASNPEMVSRITVPGAEHGISYLVDTQRYCQTVTDFMNRVLT